MSSGPELQGISGVNSVSISGGSNKQVIITLDTKKLAAKGLTAAQVTGVLQANNITFPTGTIVTGGQSVPVVVGHEFNSVDDLRKVVVGMQMPAGMGAGTGAPVPAREASRTARRPAAPWPARREPRRPAPAA